MSEPVIRLAGVGKMYKVFPNKLDNLIDALGFSSVVGWKRSARREFWALRGVDLEVPPGSRLGIVGRNGAGKSTLLKLITGNLSATEGTVEVRESIHALLDAGAGFHPEFTGYENVRASLAYQGLSGGEMERAVEEIAEFTELGAFLDQPYRTYSSGMQARLAFAAATAVVRPKVIVIDEVLGAGDAYFIGKSNERMRQLVQSGATVLIVSHSLDHVTRICEEAIWVDRGVVVRRGPALEVVKAYQQFTRLLEDRRLRARNRRFNAAEVAAGRGDEYADTVALALSLEGPRGTSCRVSRLALLRGDEVEEELLVGSAQDADPSHASFVITDQSDWLRPEMRGGVACRRLAPGAGRPAVGRAAFNLYAVHDEQRYALEATYRMSAPGRLAAEVSWNGAVQQKGDLPPAVGEWRKERLPLILHRPEGSAAAPALVVGSGTAAGRRWPGEATLTIEEVRLLDGEGRERAAFDHGERMVVRVSLAARQTGTFDLVPTAVFYRLDGTLVTRQIGDPSTLTVREGDRPVLRLDMGPINFGNGRYLISLAMYRTLDLTAVQPARTYDLVDRSFEFSVSGTPPLLDGIFRHPGTWVLEERTGA